MARGFAERFGRAPELWARAPGRVDAMGSHTDYNDGFVLTLAIDRDTWAAFAPRDDGRVRVASANAEGEARFDSDRPLAEPAQGWPLYVQGVADVLRRAGHPLAGCDVLLHGTLPIASGLSSSASLEVVVAVVFEMLSGACTPGVELARLCQRAENEVVGVSCGVLDQYSSLMGEAGAALLLDCRSLTHEVARLPEGLVPVVCDTRAPRRLAGSEYGDRRASCEAGAAALARHLPGVAALRDVDLPRFEAHAASLPEPTRRRCRFVIEENARVLALAAAFEHDDRTTIEAACVASYVGARDLYEISTAEMQAMCDAMTAAPGCVGARQAGAGFGGCMIALVEAEEVAAFADATARRYEAATGIAPELTPVEAVAGAGPLDG